MEQILSMISNVGYPIAMSLILLWYIKTKEDSNTAVLNELKAKEEANTEVLKELKEVLSVIKEHLYK